MPCGPYGPDAEPAARSVGISQSNGTKRLAAVAALKKRE
jgi:hypothetical protein